ncbi:hypothetical protein WA026_011671 [Henosepilachna vigintioctopunctata]|uniref:Uncharacterized protein n=1 Tax=Henosepilachna vigintioctopunctata TaxID=420089 RepID=A0AAW1TJY3_9CUCU
MSLTNRDLLYGENGTGENAFSSPAFFLSNNTFEGFDYGPLQTLQGETSSPFIPTAVTTAWTSTDQGGMSSFVKLAWTFVFAAMIIVACGGNCIVIWIVIEARRSKRSVKLTSSISHYEFPTLIQYQILGTQKRSFWTVVWALESTQFTE